MVRVVAAASLRLVTIRVRTLVPNVAAALMRHAGAALAAAVVVEEVLQTIERGGLRTALPARAREDARGAAEGGY